MKQFVTLTEFKFNSFQSKLWAFFMMQFAHQSLSKVQGQEFYKLFGSGKSNFNPFPDWSTYAILQTWKSKEDATNFFEKSQLYKRYRQQSKQHKIIEMQPIQSRGLWNSKNPFRFKSSEISNTPSDSKIAVITRASIKPSKLLEFWKAVPNSQKPLQNAVDLIYTKGYGEVPFFEMATFSLWKSIEGLNKFAYQSQEHVNVIKKTRQINWYSEELFARFRVLDIKKITST
ncbi:DUF3291 domain-containing protein [Psychroflexus sp. ALD_RP9]|uniref:DUF3291 domain-containing protein n=1 Tax=Psychroflexus sp. ALD_RP9 TaxID=2777186 RepID=UPI001A8D210D|nr:DUF3291 domain-containing protein [Psychroflexus sp. ALD_RP9]QSS97576.1 DUF3291 domain-containing protein [Psychroflexus sp. ALD_RP9]